MLFCGLSGCYAFKNFTRSRIMKFIFAFSVPSGTNGGVMQSRMSTAGNMQSQFQAKGLRSMQIAQHSMNLPQSAWFLINRRLIQEGTFLPLILLRRQAARMFLKISRLDIPGLLSLISNRYIYCWLKFVRSHRWRTKRNNPYRNAYENHPSPKSRIGKSRLGFALAAGNSAAHFVHSFSVARLQLTFPRAGF